MGSGKVFCWLLTISLFLFCPLVGNKANVKAVDDEHFCERLLNCCALSDRSDRNTCVERLIRDYQILPDDCDRCLSRLGQRDTPEKKCMEEICDYVRRWWKKIEIDLVYYSFVSGQATIQFEFKNYGWLSDTLRLDSLQKYQLGKETLYFKFPGSSDDLKITIGSPQGQILPSEWYIYIDNSDVAKRKKIKLFLPLLNREEPAKGCEVIIFEDISGSIGEKQLTGKVDSLKKDILAFCERMEILDTATIALGGSSTCYDKDVFDIVCGRDKELDQRRGEAHLRFLFILTDGYYSKDSSDERSIVAIRKEEFSRLRDSFWDMCECVYESGALRASQRKIDTTICPVLIMPAIVSEKGFVYTEFRKDNPLKFWKDLTSYSQVDDYLPLRQKLNPITWFKRQFELIKITLTDAKCSDFSNPCMNISLRLDPDGLLNGAYDSISYDPGEVDLCPFSMDNKSYSRVKARQEGSICAMDLLAYDKTSAHLSLALREDEVNNREIKKRNFWLCLHRSSETDSVLVRYNWPRTLPFEVDGRELKLKNANEDAPSSCCLYSRIKNADRYKDIKWTEKNPDAQGTDTVFVPKEPINDFKWLALSLSGAILSRRGKNQYVLKPFTQSDLFSQPGKSVVQWISGIIAAISFSIILPWWKWLAGLISRITSVVWQFLKRKSTKTSNNTSSPPSQSNAPLPTDAGSLKENLKKWEQPTYLVLLIFECLACVSFLLFLPTELWANLYGLKSIIILLVLFFPFVVAPAVGEMILRSQKRSLIIQQGLVFIYSTTVYLFARFPKDVTIIASSGIWFTIIIGFIIHSIIRVEPTPKATAQ